MIKWLKGLFKKANPLIAQGKLYIIECDITFNNKVVGKKKFSIYSKNKFAAKSAIVDEVKITPKRVYRNKKK